MDTKGWFHGAIGQVPGWLSRECGLDNKRHGLILLENYFLKGQTRMRRVNMVEKDQQQRLLRDPRIFRI